MLFNGVYFWIIIVRFIENLLIFQISLFHVFESLWVYFCLYVSLSYWLWLFSLWIFLSNRFIISLASHAFNWYRVNLFQRGPRLDGNVLVHRIIELFLQLIPQISRLYCWIFKESLICFRFSVLDNIFGLILILGFEKSVFVFQSRSKFLIIRWFNRIKTLILLAISKWILAIKHGTFALWADIILFSLLDACP